MAKTRVFSYDGYIGIESSTKADGLLNDPTQPGQLGFVVDAKHVEVSDTALALLKTVKRSHDAIGDVDVFQSTKGPVFAWLGRSLAMLDPTKAEGSRTYDPSLLDKAAQIVPNNPPQAFIDHIIRLRTHTAGEMDV